MDARRPTRRHIIIKRPKVEDKERLLKAAREKKLTTGRMSDGRGVGEDECSGEGLRSAKGGYRITLGM